MPGRSKKSRRYSILVMRPRGGAATFSLSPVFLFLLILFLLVFGVISIVIINRYFSLYLEHDDLKSAHQSATEELFRLQNLYSYQAMLSRDYASYVNSAVENSGGWDDGQFIPLGSLPLDSGLQALDLLDAWSANFPDPIATEDHVLDVDEFEVKNGFFKFRLLNEGDGQKTLHGRLLLLFTVLYPGDNQLVLVPYPEFDPKDREPDFNAGILYSLKADKSVYGNLNLPPEARVVEMMIIARAQDVGVVLKKKLAPAG